MVVGVWWWVWLHNLVGACTCVRGLEIFAVCVWIAGLLVVVSGDDDANRDGLMVEGREGWVRGG